MGWNFSYRFIGKTSFLFCHCFYQSNQLICYLKSQKYCWCYSCFECSRWKHADISSGNLMVFEDKEVSHHLDSSYFVSINLPNMLKFDSQATVVHLVQTSFVGVRSFRYRNKVPICFWLTVIKVSFWFLNRISGGLVHLLGLI